MMDKRSDRPARDGAKVGRRAVLRAGAALALGAGALPLGSGRAGAGRDDAEAVIRAFTGGRAPVEGRVALDLPALVDNGFVVPLKVAVESPMTAADHVQAVLVVAPGNPRPEVVTFRFTPASGRAGAETRIRLAESQEVVAVARMADGSVFLGRRAVRVTVGGCTG